MADIVSFDTIRSLDSEPADAEIKRGEPAVRVVGGGVRPLDVVNDTEVDYIVSHFSEADWNLRYSTDYVDTYDELFTYLPESAKTNLRVQGAWDDEVPLIPLVDKDGVRLLSIEDETQPEPTFEDNAEVGFVDLGNGPRLVPAGYTDDGGTQYGNGGGGDYVAVGKVDKQEPFSADVPNYGELIPVRIE